MRRLALHWWILIAMGLGVAYCPDGGQLAVNDGRDILLYPTGTDHWRRDPRQLLEAAMEDSDSSERPESGREGPSGGEGAE